MEEKGTDALEVAKEKNEEREAQETYEKELNLKIFKDNSISLSLCILIIKNF